MAYTYEYPRPAVTVDMVIVVRSRILLILRGQEPFKDLWALPGGFLDIDEELDDAAARELEEETGLTGIALKQIRAFGTVGRDPRGRTVSIVYRAELDEEPPTQAGDDAKETRWFPMDRLPALAFDHAEIIAHAKRLKDQR